MNTIEGLIAVATVVALAVGASVALSRKIHGELKAGRMSSPAYQHLRDLALKASAGDIEKDRGGKYITEVELAVSYYAFSVWLGTGLQARERGSEYFFTAPDVTSREIALKVMELISKNPRLVERIERRFGTFNAEKELEWGRSQADHSEWKRCFTRGIVIGTRSLAYSFCGAIQSIFPIGDTAFGTAIVRMETGHNDVMKSWLEAALDEDCARQLLVPREFVKTLDEKLK